MKATKLDVSATVDPKKLAKRWVQLKQEIGAREKELQTVVKDLRDWVEATGEQTIGDVMAYSRANPAKVVGPDGKPSDLIVTGLIAELANTIYVQERLDVTALKNDFALPQVQKALQKTGAQLLVVEEIQFKRKP